MNEVFHTVLSGRCDTRPDLATTDLPLVLRVPTLPCRGGAGLAARLFEPLGWQIDAAPVPLDPQLPGWGDPRFVDLTLTGSMRLATALSHLYVLLPVLDDANHYWVSTEEVDELLRAGTGAGRRVSHAPASFRRRGILSPAASWRSREHRTHDVALGHRARSGAHARHEGVGRPAARGR